MTATSVSPEFLNHILDCMEDVIFTTASDLCEAMLPRIQRRPHLETIRFALRELMDKGLIEAKSKPNGGRGLKRIYCLARTKPIIASLRNAA